MDPVQEAARITSGSSHSPTGQARGEDRVIGDRDGPAVRRGGIARPEQSAVHVSPASPTPPHNAVVRFVRHRPLTSWLIWAFTVGQVFAFVPAVAALNGVEFLGRPLVHQSFVCLATLIGLFLPAVVITRIVDGPHGLRAYLRSAFAVGVPLRWYALAIVGVPVVAMTLAVVLLGAPDPGVSIGTALLSGLVLQFVLTFLPNNWWEEVAWMGFVQRRLQARYSSAVLAALMTAPLFALYHVSLVLGGGASGAMLLGILLVLAVPFRMVIGWAFNRTDSLFLAGLLHGMSNAVAMGAGFGLGTGLVPALYPDGGFVAALIHLLTFAVIGLVVVVASRGRLGLQRPAPSFQEEP